MAGAYFKNEDEARRLWRYLNLAHALAFVGLSPTYTPDNLLNGFIEGHDLHLETSEIEQLRKIGVEAGQGAYLQCIQWALLVISAAPEADENDTSYIHFMKVYAMQNEILLFRRSIAALFAYHFQVIPYAYTHMISLVSTIYLLTFAVLKGAEFSPDASIAFGFIFPVISLSLTTLSCVGLLEVGSTITNPWGGELEDFAVFHFLDSAALHTRSLVETSKLHMPRQRERTHVLSEAAAAAAVAAAAAADAQAKETGRGTSSLVRRASRELVAGGVATVSVAARLARGLAARRATRHAGRIAPCKRAPTVMRSFTRQPSPSGLPTEAASRELELVYEAEGTACSSTACSPTSSTACSPTLIRLSTSSITTSNAMPPVSGLAVMPSHEAVHTRVAALSAADVEDLVEVTGFDAEVHHVFRACMIPPPHVAIHTRVAAISAAGVQDLVEVTNSDAEAHHVSTPATVI